MSKVFEDSVEASVFKELYLAQSNLQFLVPKLKLFEKEVVVKIFIWKQKESSRIELIFENNCPQRRRVILLFYCSFVVLPLCFVFYSSLFFYHTLYHVLYTQMRDVFTRSIIFFILIIMIDHIHRVCRKSKNSTSEFIEGISATPVKDNIYHWKGLLNSIL